MVYGNPMLSSFSLASVAAIQRPIDWIAAHMEGFVPGFRLHSTCAACSATGGVIPLAKC
jgi:hypothetical protein